MSVTTINPATENVLAEYGLQSQSQVNEFIQQSAEAYTHWRRVSLQTRLECVRQLQESLRASRVNLAEMMTREMGKPIRESLAEIDKCVVSCQALRELYPSWKKGLEYDLDNGYSVRREPMGPVLAIMPWNFPLWQVIRFALPALLGGNTILLKHSVNTWGSAEFIADLFRQVLPDGVYINLQIDHELVPGIIADSRVRGVSLTGSRRAGMLVGEQAGKHLKKCVLELGGSDAYVVLEDADIDQAAEICAKSRLLNGGQSCVSAKRFIVTKKNVKPFTEGLRAHLAKAKLGDPLKKETDVGPLARKDLRDELHKQVRKSVEAGAKIILGGELPSGKGYFYPPSVLTGVHPGQAAFDEELFGPVAAVVEAEDETQAFQLANRSIYGLGGAVFSKDVERARELARTELDAGMVAVNDMVRSDASAPFGGVRDSGLGRELGREGSFEFTTIKTLFLLPQRK